jgi:hypothetical protein
MAFAAPLLAAVPAFLGSTTGLAALGLASGGIAAASAISNGNYQAAVAKNNARIMEQNAARLSEASQVEAQRSDRDYRALLAEQAAQQGVSGFDILGRSFQRAQLTTRQTGRRAASDIRLEGEAAAQGKLQEAANERAAGRQARIQGYTSAAGSLLGAASDVGTLVRGRRARSFERRRNY